MTKRHTWTEEQIALLGKDTDSAIAKLLGINTRQVTTKRHKLKIAGFTQFKQIEWTDEIIAQLGVVSDSEIARQLGVFQSVVSGKRNRMGIPTKYNHNAIEKLTNDLSDELAGGKVREMASRHGISKTSIYRARKALNLIAPVHKWTDEDLELLKTKSDKDIAAQLGVSISAVKHQRIKQGRSDEAGECVELLKASAPQAVKKLGTMSDNELAGQYNLPTATVTLARKSLRIPQFKPKRGERNGQTAENLAVLLKEKPISIVAGLTGYTPSHLYQLRKELVGTAEND